jgi:hypothetical protein
MDGRELYDTLVARGIEIDHHESSLYFPVTDETTALVNEFEHKKIVETFTSQLDGKLWYDVPFGYVPFWDKLHETKRVD